MHLKRNNTKQVNTENYVLFESQNRLIYCDDTINRFKAVRSVAGLHAFTTNFKTY